MILPNCQRWAKGGLVRLTLAHALITIYDTFRFISDKIPPTVVSCPNITKVVTPQRISQVFFTEPVFTDNKQVTVIQKSHRPGVSLAWGDYVVTYIAQDAFGNSASCTFDLNVMRKSALCCYYAS